MYNRLTSGTLSGHKTAGFQRRETFIFPTLQKSLFKQTPVIKTVENPSDIRLSQLRSFLQRIKQPGSAVIVKRMIESMFSRNRFSLTDDLVKDIFQHLSPGGRAVNINIFASVNGSQIKDIFRSCQNHHLPILPIDPREKAAAFFSFRHPRFE